MRAALLTLTPIALLAACSQSAAPEAVLETVRATEQAQFEAIAARDLRGATRNYDDDAVLLAQGRAASVGVKAIGNSYEAMLADPNFRIEVTPGRAWAASSGDMAVTTYTAKVTATDSATGKPATRSIANNTVWRKADGSPWMIVSDYQLVLPEDETA